MNSLAVITSVTTSPVVAVFVSALHGWPVFAIGRSTGLDPALMVAMVLFAALLDTILTTSSSGTVLSTSTRELSVISASVSVLPALFARSLYATENDTTPS